VTITQPSNAKINLGLYVTERRPDGFHNLETVFFPVRCADFIEITPSDELFFESYNRSIPGEPLDNLCVKAYQLLQTDFDLPPVSIRLLKNLPIGAGMGGGSSNGTFTLIALDKLFGLSLSADKLKKYAAQLGSDCPFFIENKPILAKGTGDVFDEIALDLSGHQIVLIYPNLHINTGKAFSKISPKEPEHSLRETLTKPIVDWKKYLFNDFESAIFPDNPVLSNIKKRLYDAGALYASMSGSGSTIFGIFKGKKNIKLSFDANFWQYKFVV